MKLRIKNMVSNRCKMLVREELNKFGLHFIIVTLGEVDVMEDLSVLQLEQIKENLLQAGLELMDNKQAILVDTIKNIIIKMVWKTDEPLKIKFSNFLSEKLHHNYTYLANLFSAIQGTSIQQFIILNKIERIKELMFYDELNITEISYKMNYSSVAHLSNQFKKVTGLTPSFFKKLKHKRLIALEDL